MNRCDSACAGQRFQPQQPMPNSATGLPSWPTRLQLRLFERQLIHAVVAERREAEQHLDAAPMRVRDEFAREVRLHILVLLRPLPRDGKFLRAKRAAHPENHRVRPILRRAVENLPPHREAEGRHAHEAKIVSALREDGRSLRAQDG